jgi:hypothetical protein
VREITDDDIQRRIHGEVLEYVETVVRRNQPHSPNLSVGAFDTCDKTITDLVIPLENVNRTDLFQLVDDLRAFPIPGVNFDEQKDADGYFQKYIHVPWIEPEPLPAASAERGQRVPRPMVRSPVKPAFSMTRLQTWISALLLTGVFALAKGPYLGW